jgi:hypothetical protein
MESLEDYRRRLTPEQQLSFDLQRSAFIQGHRVSSERKKQKMMRNMLEYINSNQDIILPFDKNNKK